MVAASFFVLIVFCVASRFYLNSWAANSLLAESGASDVVLYDAAIVSAPLETRSWLPPKNRPHYDLVIAVFVVGGFSQEALEEVERVRRVYARYGSHVQPAGDWVGVAPLTIRVVFIVGRAGLSEAMHVPASGLLLGDFFHVDVREGYTHLSDKTKAMMALSDHLR